MIWRPSSRLNVLSSGMGFLEMVLKGGNLASNGPENMASDVVFLWGAPWKGTAVPNGLVKGKQQYLLVLERELLLSFLLNAL